jgi:LacI family transcriptional regulator
MVQKPPSRSAPTISQVAAAAGVSRSTVSRAFSRPEAIGQATADRIRELAREMGYAPNHTARALSTGRHGNIGLIVPDVSNPFFPPLIRGAQVEADRADFCVFLGNSDENPSQEAKLLERFSGQVEGVVLVSSRLTDEQIIEAAQIRPVVLVNRDVEGIPRVLIDSSIGVSEAVAHLVALGHRNIVYVSGPSKSWSNRQRRNAFKRAVKLAGIEASIVYADMANYDSGRAQVPKILAAGASAAICFDDLMAQGVMGGLAERDVPVPARFSVIGCDDVIGATTYPALTSVSSPTLQAGRTAVSILLDRLEDNTSQDIRYTLDTRLVTRQTTGPV